MVKILLFLLLFSSIASAQEVREYIDLQMHPTMHIPYSFFGKGFKYFKTGKEPRLTYKHQFTNVNYTNYFKNNKGARIIVPGAIAREGIKSPSKARNLILKQLDYIHRFANENSDHFVVAMSPSEARQLIATTDKTIILLSIEGGKSLINRQEDALFWASKGITFITLIHLVDSDLGTSAIKPGFMLKVINPKGALKNKNKRGGLTEKGRNAISWLSNAGIMTDITHMSDKSRIDALNYMEEKGIPPISTHDLFRPIQNHPRGMTEEQIIRIYRNNGFISLPISGFSLEAYKPEEKHKNALDTLSCFCSGSIDSYKFTYLAVKNVIESNFKTINTSLNSNSLFSNLSEKEKVRYSIGFQSDFNGWLNHSRPRFGKKGCSDLKSGVDYEEIETKGMPHAGLLSSQWRLLEKEGVDLEPIKRNSEKFLQLWEFFLERKGTF